MDKGAWQVMGQGVPKVRLKQLSTHTQIRQGFHDRATQCAISGLLTVAKRDFPSGPVVKTPLDNTGDTGSIPGLGTKSSHATVQSNK